MKTQEQANRLYNFLFALILILAIFTTLFLASCSSPSEKSSGNNNYLGYVGIEKLSGCIICSKKLLINSPFTVLGGYNPKTGKYFSVRVANVMVKNKAIGDTIK